MQGLSTLFQRRARSSGAAFGGLAAVAAIMIAGCGSSQGTGSTPTIPNTPSTAKVTHRSDLLTIMQADGELDDPQANPATTIDALASFGATTIRTIVNWDAFAPDAASHAEPTGFDGADPGDYSPKVWATLDAADREAQKDGVSLFVTLNGLAPVWATGPDPEKGVSINAWKPSPTDYAQWVKAMGLRYSGNYKPKGQSSPLPRIHFWSIWNEPNEGVNIAPVATDHGKIASGAAQYRTLVEAGWNALVSTGHTTETDTILIGETAPRGISGPGQPAKPAEGMVPTRFIQALYCANAADKPLHGTAAREIGCPTTSAGVKAFAAKNPALFKASGWADHPYPDGEAPTVNTEPKGTTGYTDFANLGNLMTTLDKLTGAYGRDPKFSIYNTEYGYTTKPLGLVSQAKAAYYINESEYITWTNPRIASYDQYEWHDSPPPATFTTGLYEWNGPAKQSLPAFLMPLWLPKTSASKGTALQVWGCARQAVGFAKTTKQAQQVAIQLSTDGGKTYKTIKTVTLDPSTSGCYFDTEVKFPAGGDVRTTWDDNGTPTYSRTQAIKLS